MLNHLATVQSCDLEIFNISITLMLISDVETLLPFSAIPQRSVIGLLELQSHCCSRQTVPANMGRVKDGVDNVARGRWHPAMKDAA